MTADKYCTALRTCRSILAERLGLPRPLTLDQMATGVLGLSGDRASHDLLKMESGARPISGPIRTIVEMIHDGATPPAARRLAPGRHSRRALVISDDDLAAAIAANGTLTAAARELGCSVTWLSRRARR